MNLVDASKAAALLQSRATIHYSTSAKLIVAMVADAWAFSGQQPFR